MARSGIDELTGVDVAATENDDDVLAGESLAFFQVSRDGDREYDGENRMTKGWGTGGWNYYVYDGDGQRVRRVVWVAGVLVEYWQVYDFDGALIAEYLANGAAGTTNKEYGYRGGQMLLVGGCDVARWLVNDHLGTPRIEVDVTGSLANVRRHDYLPFGEELTAGMGNGSARSGTMGYVADCVRQRFGSKERDTETGLDYFLARYYGSTQGRFTSPDPIIISDKQVESPQLWNLYNYVGNNPLAYTDPTGMELVRLGQHTDEEIKRRQAEIKQQLQALKQNKSISKDERTAQEKALKAENNTLSLEREGNQVGNALLASLDAKGARNGLKLSDLTLSTDSKHDFDNDKRVGDDPGKGAGMFVLNGYSRQIYLNRRSNDYSLYKGGDADGVLYGGTALRHEQVHRDNYPRGDSSERAAYSLQLKLLQQYGPGAFKSRDFYDTAIQHVTEGSKRKD